MENFVMDLVMYYCANQNFLSQLIWQNGKNEIVKMQLNSICIISTNIIVIYEINAMIPPLNVYFQVREWNLDRICVKKLRIILVWT